jgi:methylated-DNA-protein-cysteine methyltransferase-like protein
MVGEATGFRQAVLAVVGRIPRGKVTTYGRIAEAIGHPRRARHVGMALARSGEAEDYPCHRVVNRDGYLSGGWAFGHPEVMRQLLEEEEVTFVAPLRVDLSTCLWEPAQVSEGDRSPTGGDEQPPEGPDAAGSPR